MCPGKGVVPGRVDACWSWLPWMFSEELNSLPRLKTSAAPVFSIKTHDRQKERQGASLELCWQFWLMVFLHSAGVSYISAAP